MVPSSTKTIRQKVTDLTADDSSEDEGNDQNGPNVEQEERSPMDRDLAFDLDGDVNLDSKFLQDMLSDVQQCPASEDATTLVVIADPAGTNSELTEEDWENI